MNNILKVGINFFKIYNVINSPTFDNRMGDNVGIGDGGLGQVNMGLICL